MLEVETDRARRATSPPSADAPVAGLKKVKPKAMAIGRFANRTSRIVRLLLRDHARGSRARAVGAASARHALAFPHGVSGGRLRLGALRARAHLGAFARRYGASVALDLPSGASSSESRLGASYAAAAHAAETHVRLVSFDLSNAIARRGDREALATLLRLTETDAARHGFWFDSTPVSVGASAAIGVSRKDARADGRVSRQLQGLFGPHERRASRARVPRAPIAASRERVRRVESRGAQKNARRPLVRAGDDVDALARGARAAPRRRRLRAARRALGALADARVAVRRWWQSKFSDGNAQDAARFFTSGGELFEASGQSGHSPERTSLKKKTEEENALEKNAPDETTRDARARTRRGFFCEDGFPVSAREPAAGRARGRRVGAGGFGGRKTRRLEARASRRPTRPRARGVRAGGETRKTEYEQFMRARAASRRYRHRCGHENEIYGSRPGLTSTRGRAPYAAERPFAAILRMSSPISSRFFLPRPWVPSCFVREKRKGGIGSAGPRVSGARREARGRGTATASRSRPCEPKPVEETAAHARRARFPSRGGPADAGGFAAPRASRETLETFLCRYAPSAWRA